MCLIARFFPWSCLERPFASRPAQAAVREKSSDETQQQILQQQTNMSILYVISRYTEIRDHIQIYSSSGFRN